MDEIQNQLSSGSQSLSQTQNPQAISTQDLGSGQNNLQTSSSNILDQSGLKIAGVQNVKTQAVTPDNPIIQQSTSTSLTPIVLAFGAGIILLAGLVVLAIKKGKPAQNKTESS